VLVVFQDHFDFPVPEDVKIINFHKESISALPGFIWQLARVYEKEKPDTVVSYIDHINIITVLAKRFSRTKPKLVLNTVNHTSTIMKQHFRSRLQGLAITYLYPEADYIICLSKGVANDLVTEFRIPQEKIRIIYGQVDIDCVSNQAKEEVDASNSNSRTMPVIVAMGRLQVQKGYPYLFKAFTQVAAEFPSRLVILGDGGERSNLEKLARQLGIERQVTFLGFQTNPFKYLARSDIFVLSSLWEGFALVIVEAMACGIPVISTRCPSGPDEIITDGVNGLLVPVADETALAGAILRLLKDKKLAVKLAQGGTKRAEDFAITKIIKQYEAIF
jgi:glycosyltransferase involved in cell wall biosynthesis